MIPCANPGAQYRSHRAEIQEAIDRVLEQGRYILGEEVSAFERELAQYLGVAHGVGVATGTDALHLALRAADVGAGDEVVTVSHTAVATVAAVQMAGATPCLVDIERDYATLDPAGLNRAITDRTKAVIAVHLYGQPCDLPAITSIVREHGLTLIEDCAQAAGASLGGRRVGSFGDLACFSFYPTKNLGAVGDGGFIATGRREYADRLRALREYGWRERYVSEEPGFNSRLDELQAAVLRVKLVHLDADNAARTRIARVYDEGLRGTSLQPPRVRTGGAHAYHLYVARTAQRDAARASLLKRGIETAIHYPRPVHRQPAYARIRIPPEGLPESDRAAREVLSLPMFPELPLEDARTVVEAAQVLSRIPA